MLSGIGGFYLAYLAMGNPDQMRLFVCGLYDVLLFVPTVWLYVTKG